MCGYLGCKLFIRLSGLLEVCGTENVSCVFTYSLYVVLLRCDKVDALLYFVN